MAVEVGIRELRENLSEWLERAAKGEELVVTERGRPKVRIAAASGEHLLDRLVREGRATPSTRPRRWLPPPLEVDGNPVTEALLTHRRAKEF